MELPKRMTSLCPHCNVTSVFVRAGERRKYTDVISVKAVDNERHDVTVTFEHGIYTCVNCSKDTYVLFRDSAQVVSDALVPGMPQDVKEIPAEMVHQYPVATPSVHEAVPDDVRKAAVEAEKCLSVGAFNACGVMARRSVDCLCLNKGATGQSLYDRLKCLRDNNLITPDLWEWAEELRIVGRSGAHPEWEEVSGEEAEYAVKFLREIIRYIYINPAERAQRRLKETKKKK
jgi:hypothetical protein